jgi:hypothetical protein
MKTSKIIAGLLVLIGFGSCAPRASKSPAPEQPALDVEVKADSIEIPRAVVMYGVPSRPFDPNRVPKEDTTEQPKESNLNPPVTE